MFVDQSEYRVRCEWSERGIAALRDAEQFVIVDVLSFTTCVDIAISRGAEIYPYDGSFDGIDAFAEFHHARIASRGRTSSAPSLSPVSMQLLKESERLVLPSPNGSRLSLAAEGHPTIAGSLRNATAVANALTASNESVAIIPCGERWPDGTLRFALEDWIGAGAIIHHLTGSKSPEAFAAEGAFLATAANLQNVLLACSSGKELIERGAIEDVLLAAALNESNAVPQLQGVRYVRG